MNNKEVEEITSNVKKYFDYDSAKKILKEKYEAKMLFAAYGGMWKAGPELLVITQGFQDIGEVVLLDEYGNPCKVEPTRLRITAYERWQEQMNAWHYEYEGLHRKL